MFQCQTFNITLPKLSKLSLTGGLTYGRRCLRCLRNAHLKMAPTCKNRKCKRLGGGDLLRQHVDMQDGHHTYKYDHVWWSPYLQLVLYDHNLIYVDIYICVGFFEVWFCINNLGFLGYSIFWSSRGRDAYYYAYSSSYKLHASSRKSTIYVCPLFCLVRYYLSQCVAFVYETKYVLGRTFCRWFRKLQSF